MITSLVLSSDLSPSSSLLLLCDISLTAIHCMEGLVFHPLRCVILVEFTSAEPLF